MRIYLFDGNLIMAWNRNQFIFGAWNQNLITPWEKASSAHMSRDNSFWINLDIEIFQFYQIQT